MKKDFDAQSYNVTNPIAQGSIQNPYKEFPLVVAAGATETVFYVSDFFRVLSLTADANALQVRFGGSGSESNFTGAGLGYKLLQPVDRIAIRNTGATPMTILIALAVGDIRDDRLTVSGTINVTQATNTTALTHAAVSVTASATSLIAASSSRKSLLITNNDIAQNLFIGGSGVTTSNGTPIPPGGSFGNNNDGAQYFGIVVSGTLNARVLSN